MSTTGHRQPRVQAFVCLSLTLLLAAVALAQGAPPVAPSQTPAAGATRPSLRVFLDCNNCDEEYLRQNVQFIDYVRDRTVADLHVLVTTQDTGGGGASWVVKFIGLGRWQGQDRSLAFSTPSTTFATSIKRTAAPFL